MATIFYDTAPVQVEVGIYRETMLATDCSINFTSRQQPIYSVGKKGPLGQFPSAARVGDMSFSFLTSITGQFDNIEGAGNQSRQGNIINFLANGVKRSTNSEISGATVQCAGVKGFGFLNSYSFSVSANSVSTSSASFTMFGSGTQLPLSGRLTGVDGNVGIGTTVATGIAHGRFTTMPSALRTQISSEGSAPETATIYGADYSISFNHSPLYKIGQEFPTTSFYTTASESLNITEDLFNSGLKFDEDAASYTLEIKGLKEAPANSMKVRITSAKQINTSASVGLDDIIRTQKTLTAAY